MAALLESENVSLPQLSPTIHQTLIKAMDVIGDNFVHLSKTIHKTGGQTMNYEDIK